MQEPRRGRPLSPLRNDLGPEMTAWANRLREFYTSLGMTLGELERLVGIDATTLSRYLNGRRLPEIAFLGKLDDAVFSRTQTRMHKDVRESVRELYLAACLVHEPQRHEVYMLRDALARAVQRAELAEETVWELQAELHAEQRRRELVENSLRQLEARTGPADDVDTLRRERARALAERDMLTALMEQHSAELVSAMREQYAIAQAREQLATELHGAERVLDEHLESRWGSPDGPDPGRSQEPRPPKAGRWRRRRAGTRRRQRTDLETLRARAEHAARELPRVVGRFSAGDVLDADLSSLLPLPASTYSDDDIARVAAAMDLVLHDAVRLAGEQALLRGNVNAMFTNLSRRSQGLLQRQISLISELEEQEADAAHLASLFKLDHLATRMMRNGENLLVLAGEEPGRRWTSPVPLVDVLRAAASEVEQYERIELTSVPAVEVAGRVVTDLVHLLAELLENATSFSSPQTKVRVTGHALPDGRVLIGIDDAGIGLSAEDLADINERLAAPPTVDAAVSHRMGLFVVGRLSLRHGVRVQLRGNGHGGTEALVMLPVDAVHAEGEGAPAPAPAPDGAGDDAGGGAGGGG
ncbi:putative sensor-like histidine kinase [Actinacidiphila reveromycinica]|uniref:histidine kinase n=1 Tax=Actinacidiphila reveromycinica TaxID=659352 RepID=A0A7U3UP21_9ACTN|nr:ATP-binding protein [Streptomyces sp. SN-593]BBA96098.1 putative sensor-like histidine kinase [Streptomyces sp. SN-593]